jgi:predicted membrane channel-forming protein YqfA (hemolysin III family)
MLFFLYFGKRVLKMKIAQYLALFLLVAGSFLPLVHIPFIGNWNYYKIDSHLAFLVWGFSVIALIGIIFDKLKIVRVTAIILLLLFIFTLTAVKFKSLNYFSFLPFKSWQESFAGIVKLSWGWILEFAGAILLLILKKQKIKN